MTAVASDLRPVTGLTAAEAAARGSQIGSTEYRVHVDLSGFPSAGTFVTTTEIRFGCHTPGRPVWLDLVADQVLTVRHNGSELDPASVVGPERLVIGEPAVSNTVVVRSRHSAGTAAAGLCRTVDPADGAVYAWTQFQPFDARRMFACFDQPDLRGTFTLEVTAPADWTCLSNTSTASGGQPGAGARAEPHDFASSCGLRRTVFAPTPPIPVYLTALCAGPFASVTAEHGAVRLGVHARASLAGELASSAPELFDLTRHGLDVFAGAFGVRYPLNTYDQVFLPDQPGAMENLGCVTWHDASLFRAEPSTAQRVRRALVLLHELSHQWFGDLVSPRWWDDLWLSESFADWAAVWALRSYRPLAGHGGGGHAAHVEAAMRADQLPGTHPVSRDVADMDAVEANFDAITYAKGACLLAQLIGLVGEDAFLAGLRGYFRRFAWGPATIDALLYELDRCTATDVRRWAAEWLRTAGVNTIRCERIGDGDAGADPSAPANGGKASAGATDPDARTGIVLLQTADPARPVLRRHRIRIGRYRLVDGRLAFSGELTVDVDRARVTILAGDVEGGDVLLINDALGGYLKSRPDPGSMRTLLALGHTLQDRDCRATLRNILSDMVFDGELDGPSAIRTLAAMVGTEDDDAALAQTIDQALEAAGGFTAPPHRGPAGAEVAAACLALTGAAAVGSSRWLAAWQGVARSAWTPEQAAALAGLLAGTGVPQALRWQALTRLVSLGRSGEAEVAAELAADSDPDANRSAAVARAALDTLSAKRAALEALLSPDQVPIGALSRLAGGLWQVHQQDLLTGVIDEFLDRLPRAILDGGPARAMRLTRWCFPSFGLGPPAIERVRRMAEDVVLPEVARTALADQAALAGRRGRAADLGPGS